MLNDSGRWSYLVSILQYLDWMCILKFRGASFQAFDAGGVAPFSVAKLDHACTIHYWRGESCAESLDKNCSIQVKNFGSDVQFDFEVEILHRKFKDLSYFAYCAWILDTSAHWNCMIVGNQILDPFVMSGALLAATFATTDEHVPDRKAAGTGFANRTL